MLLFLMGVDTPTMLLAIILTIFFGFVTFRRSRKMLRRSLRSATEGTIIIISGICTLVLAPLLVIIVLALLIFIAIQFFPVD